MFTTFCGKFEISTEFFFGRLSRYIGEIGRNEIPKQNEINTFVKFFTFRRK